MLSLIAAPAARRDGPAARRPPDRPGDRIGDRMTGELIITDGKIVSDEPWQGARADGRLIDWSGKWVLPGLIDLHTHVADGYGQSRRSGRAAEAQRGGDHPQGRRDGAHHAPFRLHHRARCRRLSRADRRRAARCDRRRRGRGAADVRRRRLHHHSGRRRRGDRRQAGNRHRPGIPHRRGARPGRGARSGSRRSSAAAPTSSS